MMRISSNMPLLDSRFQMSSLEYQLSRSEKGVSSSRAIGNLRDAPVDAAHATRLDSAGVRNSRYLANVNYAQGRMAQAEGYMNEAVSMVQRLRELSIQSATGTYGLDDMNKSAMEVNALLEELTAVMNAKGGDGQYLFAGDDTSTPPFRVSKGRVPGFSSEAIISINYAGDISRSRMEIADGQMVTMNLQGNEVFWADSQQIFGARDTEGFTVEESNRFMLDGVEIRLEPGDNIHTVVRKINDSDTAVKASLDPVTGSLNLETTVPHQIWLESVEGNALRDAGLLQEAGNGKPPQNWHPDAMVFGGDLFSQIMALRDTLLAGNQEKIGGAVVGGIDKGLDNLLRNLADLGAKSNRLQFASTRLEEDTEILGNWKSGIADLNITEAITEMRMLEFARKAAYQVAGRLLPTTLMDYLR